MKEISPQNAADAMAAGTALILDVREDSELLEAAVDGVRHIPMQQVPERLNELDPAQRLIVMCKLGGRSAMVCEHLNAQGFADVSNLTGGIYAWAAEVDETVIK